MAGSIAAEEVASLGAMHSAGLSVRVWCSTCRTSAPLNLDALIDRVGADYSLVDRRCRCRLSARCKGWNVFEVARSPYQSWLWDRLWSVAAERRAIVADQPGWQDATGALANDLHLEFPGSLFLVRTRAVEGGWVSEALFGGGGTAIVGHSGAGALQHLAIERAIEATHAHHLGSYGGKYSQLAQAEGRPEKALPFMCGRYRNQLLWEDYCRLMDSVGMPVRTELRQPNLPSLPEVRPTNQAPIIRMADDGFYVATARWWLIPFWHRGALKDFKLTTFNAKSETVLTSRTYAQSFQRRRCLIPMNGWWEWNGPREARRKWWISADEPFMMAGVWDRCDTTDKGLIESFTMLTTPPGAYADLHHRWPLALWADEWRRWLDIDADVSDLLGREPRVAFTVSPASA